MVIGATRDILLDHQQFFKEVDKKFLLNPSDWLRIIKTGILKTVKRMRLKVVEVVTQWNGDFDILKHQEPPVLNDSCWVLLVTPVSLIVSVCTCLYVLTYETLRDCVCVCMCVCLSVCESVPRLSQKVLDGF